MFTLSCTTIHIYMGVDIALMQTYIYFYAVLNLLFLYSTIIYYNNNNKDKDHGVAGSDLIVLGQSPRHNMCLLQYKYYIEYHY